MWALHTLQDVADVSFTTASPVTWDELNAVYGTRVMPEKVRLIRAPRIPVVGGSTMAHWQRSYFERFCRSLPGPFDVCISAYNPIRFSRPAIQLIGDFSFDEEARHQLDPNASALSQHRHPLLRSMYLSVGEQLAGRGPPIGARSLDRIVANSRWTARVLEQRFQLQDVPILYPPSPLHAPAAARPRDPLGFVCMGRIVPEKEIETVIQILDLVRAAGHPATLDLVGAFGHDAYSRRILALAAERSDWVSTPGFLAAHGKGRLFASRTYAIHAARVEAFGIVVAEMAAAGLIPFVPRQGGSSEIVGMQELTYTGAAEAATKIIARLERTEGNEGIRAVLRGRAARFTPERFGEDLLSIVDEFAERSIVEA